MVVQTRVENGKAYLQFDFPQRKGDAGEQTVLLLVKDREGREVLNCFYPLAEEEPAQGILLHPHLWNGPEDPYLYKVEGYLMNEAGKIVESTTRFLALHSLEEIPGKGLFLNGKPFELRAIKWDKEEIRGREAVNILEALQGMGANTIYFPDEQNKDERELIQLCTEKGFFVFMDESKLKGNMDVPGCSILFSLQPPFLTETYYRYKALWSKEPFVHICMNSIKKQEKGTFSMTVYSNQKKVAVYVDGVLFEFRNGGQEYFFEEIPIKKYPAVLTAEAGACNTAVTIYERSQNFHRNVTFS